MRFDVVALNMRNNTLENENEILRAIIKDELYKDFINKLGEPDVLLKTKEDNKRLRKQIKELREQLNEKRNTR